MAYDPIGRPHERDVHTQIPVVGGTVQAQVYAEGDGRPRRVLCAAVKADIIALFPLQLLEDGVGCCFRRERHGRGLWMLLA